MADLNPLTRHCGIHSNSACEASSTCTAGRIVQVECGHGIAGSTNRINHKPGTSPISFIDDIGAFFPCKAICAGTDTFAIPATCTTDRSIDFRANDHPCGD
jgi:hypothetical protein